MMPTDQEMTEREWPLPEEVRLRLAGIVTSCQDALAAHEIQKLLAASDAAAHVREHGLSLAASDVLAERARQVIVEGRTPEGDDEYQFGELERAAACYAVSEPSVNWWPRGWVFKRDTPRASLVKAAALLLAAIERLDRQAARFERRAAA